MISASKYFPTQWMASPHCVSQLTNKVLFSIMDCDIFPQNILWYSKLYFWSLWRETKWLDIITFCTFLWNKTKWFESCNVCWPPRVDWIVLSKCKLYQMGEEIGIELNLFWLTNIRFSEWTECCQRHSNYPDCISISDCSLLKKNLATVFYVCNS